MKKLPSTFANMVLVLTGITVVMIGLLAVVNALTEDKIREANLKTLQDAVKAVLPEGYDNDPIGDQTSILKDGVTYMVYPGKKGDETIGAAVEASSLGFGGELRVLVGFDKEGNINDYSLLSHSETPGLGAKAASWFKKGEKGDITGMNAATPLTVSKDGGQVDAITASTITSRAFLKAVNAAYAIYMNEDIDSASGASSQVTETKTDTKSSASQQTNR